LEARVRIADIQIGERHRKDMGDIEGLARSIDEIGLLHPVVVRPDGTLVAGERRIKACLLLGWQDIPVTVVDLDAIIRGECDENQKRKDWTPTEAVAIAKELEPLEREAARERQGARNDKLPVDFTGGSGAAMDKVADAVGLSRPTLTKAQEVIEAAEENPELFGDLPDMMDETSIERAYKEKRKRERRQEMEARPVPAGKFRVLYADPPWAYDNSGFEASAESHYPTMTADKIADLPIADLCEDEAVLFLWATSPLLPEALTVMRGWGFTYKASIVWDKQRAPGLGWWLKTRHEFLLVGAREKTPHPKVKQDSIVSIAAGEHSAKPERFAEMITEMYDGPYIELFARNVRPGWKVWGNEV
jgi:N6-adenosine-specific RNA methylase IME4